MCDIEKDIGGWVDNSRNSKLKICSFLFVAKSTYCALQLAMFSLAS